MVLVFKEKNVLLIWTLRLLQGPRQLHQHRPHQEQLWECPMRLSFHLLPLSLLQGLLPPLFTFLFPLLLVLDRQLLLHQKKRLVQFTPVSTLGKGSQLVVYWVFWTQNIFSYGKKAYMAFRPSHRKYLIHKVPKH